MNNIRLSFKDYQELLDLVFDGQQLLKFLSSVRKLGSPPVEPYLFGYPLRKVSDGYVLFVACEFCGKSPCRCGAPIEWQGKPLVRAADDDIVSAVRKETLRIQTSQYRGFLGV